MQSDLLNDIPHHAPPQRSPLRGAEYQKIHGVRHGEVEDGVRYVARNGIKHPDRNARRFRRFLRILENRLGFAILAGIRGHGRSHWYYRELPHEKHK